MPITTLDQKTAFVTVDLQAWTKHLPTAPNSLDDVIANAARLGAAFRERGLPVINVKVGFSADFGDAFAPRATSPLPHPEPTPGWDDLMGELGAQASDVTVTKHQWNGFHGTDLDVQLRRRGVTGIVLSGIATAVGVESTARAAMDHAYNVTVVSDAVTDVNPAAHQNSLDNIFPRLAEVGTTDEILAVLSAS
jgi:nicotinamidase-related amidase